MLSAKDGEDDQADALDDGANDYLINPFYLTSDRP
jgi:two-component system, OmpR family, response regulator